MFQSDVYSKCGLGAEPRQPLQSIPYGLRLLSEHELVIAEHSVPIGHLLVEIANGLEQNGQ
jgi:hypothetical protein